MRPFRTYKRVNVFTSSNIIQLMVFCSLWQVIGMDFHVLKTNMKRKYLATLPHVFVNP
jgi:hypothetical protein